MSVTGDAIVKVVTLTRADRRNAFDGAMFDAVLAAATAIAEAPPRVVVVTGDGPHFSSGLDLSPANPLAQRLLPAVASRDEVALRVLIDELRHRLWALGRLPCPVICAVEGLCIGAGLELALTADLIVASEVARFSLPEAKFGFVADVGGTVRLARRVGAARATHIVLTCSEVSGVEAGRIGLADEVVPAGTARAVAEELARRIAVTSSPASTNAMIAVLRAAGAADALEAEARAGVKALAAGDIAKGLTSFLSRTPMDWTKA